MTKKFQPTTNVIEGDKVAMEKTGNVYTITWVDPEEGGGVFGKQEGDKVAWWIGSNTYFFHIVK